MTRLRMEVVVWKEDRLEMTQARVEERTVVRKGTSERNEGIGKKEGSGRPRNRWMDWIKENKKKISKLTTEQWTMEEARAQQRPFPTLDDNAEKRNKTEMMKVMMIMMNSRLCNDILHLRTKESTIIYPPGRVES